MPTSVAQATRKGKKENPGTWENDNVGRWHCKAFIYKKKAPFNCNRSNILPIERLSFNSPLHIMSPYCCLESQLSSEAHGQVLKHTVQGVAERTSVAPEKSLSSLS